jgi:hypothetical protein
VNKSFGCKSVDDTGKGSVFRVSCRWEVLVRMGCLPMTRSYFDCITWSLRYLEEHVELQTGAA